MAQTLKELRSVVLSAAGHAGQRRNIGDSLEADHDLAVAKLAFHAAKIIENCPAPFTQEDADYICAVIAARVGGGR